MCRPRCWIRTVRSPTTLRVAHPFTRDLERGAWEARALVQGSRDAPYKVSLRWTPTDIQAHCTCPFDLCASRCDNDM